MSLPPFHFIHELGCRNHSEAMIKGTIEKSCCKCAPKPDCLFESTAFFDKIEKESKQEHEMRKFIATPEDGAEKDLDGKLYKK